ncbi:hypothetical protein KR222_007370 [Zaprionus bogoriensis]|nr:hypothetical protein KR222_007370 [Zaprionus bogoriensis]
MQLFSKLRRTLKRHLKLRRSSKRRCSGRTQLLRPMPRCSSFGSSGTLLTPTKRTTSWRGKLSARDNHYAQWKCMFEHSANAKQHVPPTQRPHDISEALSGQTTPRGFPSHTDARRCPLPATCPAPPLYDCVGEFKVRRRLSFRLPNSQHGSIRRLTPRQKADQAKLDAQLQRELCDLEEYYGAFHYARRNERRI